MKHVLLFWGIFLCGAFVGSHGIEDDAPPQIIGGTEANIHEFPWQASLRIPGGNHFCGGSLISRRWVLTAGHCIVKSRQEVDGFYTFLGVKRPQDINVHLGAHHFYKMGEGQQIYAVEKVVPHQAFGTLIGKGNLENDIGLLKLAVDVQFSLAIQQIPIADANESPFGRSVILSGWGMIQVFNFTYGIADFNFCGKRFFLYQFAKSVPWHETVCGFVTVDQNPTSKINKYAFVLPLNLQKVSVQVQPEDKCKFDPMNRNNIVWCIGDKQEGSCRGDSGGPMVQKIGPTWKLFGITSYGNVVCADVEGSSRYTKTGPYKEWILNEINK